MAELKVSIPAIEKLVDYTASGIGSVAGTMLHPWRARREAKAIAIEVEGKVKRQEALAEGNANTMRIIAEAQAEAREILVSGSAEVRGELDLAQSVTQRIQFQEEKRQSNIRSVVSDAALQLEDKQASDHEPDHDWTARFFSNVQDVSDKEAQAIYARILAGEVERPGSTSLKSLSILKDLDKSAAVLFKRLRSAAIFTVNASSGRVISLGKHAATNSLAEFGLRFTDLNVLNEHGMIISDYNSWEEINTCIDVDNLTPPVTVRIPFTFSDRYWVLEPTESSKMATYKAYGVALTRAGIELAQVVECLPDPNYHQKLVAFFSSEGLTMTEVASGEPQIIPRPRTE